MERPTNRRRFLAAAVAGTTAGLAGCSVQPPIDEDAATSDPTQAATELPDTVDLETLTTGLEMPVSIAFTPDADRRYIAQRRGRILVHESAETRDEPLLDLSEAVMTGGERGLLGIALHPEFSEDRRLFVRYSAEPRSGTPSDYSHTFVLAEFQVSEDGRRAEPASERAVLEIPQPRERHNAGDLAFGPNGHLYVPVGDSAAAPDLAWQGPGTGGYAQDVTENLLGSVLRIDVDDRAEGEGYSVPADNPLVGREGLDEHYAWGFRNPWRLSFDGSDLYVADVGKDHFEEVNLVERGGNYGWNVKEGTHCFQVDDCPDETPENVRGGEPLLDPIVEYSHSGERQRRDGDRRLRLPWIDAVGAGRRLRLRRPPTGRTAVRRDASRERRWAVADQHHRGRRRRGEPPADPLVRPRYRRGALRARIRRRRRRPLPRRPCVVIGSRASSRRKR
ncbi:PQQ-dependent sugar dehydrogenase [Halalkalicoccus salilacus]|uniref:PQQ-dependent sugar dehydrogenase n=1 Tax=Halalkalicoccus sp. GCM10025704 TaxID=3252662 RepID=UPI0036105F31